MKRVLVIKDLALGAKHGGGTIAGIAEVDLLAEGALAIFTEAGGLVDGTATATDLADVDKVFFAVGKGSNTGALITQPIERRRVRTEKVAYAAPVKQKQFIGNDGSAGAFNFPTLSAGDEIFVKISDISDGTQPPKRVENYSYTVKSGDTAVTAADAMRAKIAAKSQIVTIANVGVSVGWELTAVNNGQTFEVAVDGVLENATKTVNASPAVRPTYGHGTYDQILKMEQDSLVDEGQWNLTWLKNYYFSRTTTAVSSATYDTYMIQWEQIHETATSQKTAGVWELVLAIPTAPAALTVVDAIMTVLFGAPYLAGASGGAESGT
jgi:hypothetical protein